MKNIVSFEQEILRVLVSQKPETQAVFLALALRSEGGRARLASREHVLGVSNRQKAGALRALQRAGLIQVGSRNREGAEYFLRTQGTAKEQARDIPETYAQDTRDMRKTYAKGKQDICAQEPAPSVNFAKEMPETYAEDTQDMRETCAEHGKDMREVGPPPGLIMGAGIRPPVAAVPSTDEAQVESRARELARQSWEGMPDPVKARVDYDFEEYWKASAGRFRRDAVS
jgi:hypothetical protein